MGDRDERNDQRCVERKPATGLHGVFAACPVYLMATESASAILP